MVCVHPLISHNIQTTCLVLTCPDLWGCCGTLHLHFSSIVSPEGGPSWSRLVCPELSTDAWLDWHLRQQSELCLKILQTFLNDFVGCVMLLKEATGFGNAAAVYVPCIKLTSTWKPGAKRVPQDHCPEYHSASTGLSSSYSTSRCISSPGKGCKCTGHPCEWSYLSSFIAPWSSFSGSVQGVAWALCPVLLNVTLIITLAHSSRFQYINPADVGNIFHSLRHTISSIPSSPHLSVVLVLWLIAVCTDQCITKEIWCELKDKIFLTQMNASAAWRCTYRQRSLEQLAMYENGLTNSWQDLNGAFRKDEHNSSTFCSKQTDTSVSKRYQQYPDYQWNLQYDVEVMVTSF